eukprot:s2217_g7.t1
MTKLQKFPPDFFPWVWQQDCLNVFFCSRDYRRSDDTQAWLWAMDGEIDLLALLDSSVWDEDAVVERVDGGSVGLQPPSTSRPAASSDTNSNANVNVSISLPSMRGKVGNGRHGDEKDQTILALHMRHCKTLRRESSFREGVADLLDDSTFRKNGKMISVRAERTSSGVVIKLSARSQRGNRFKKVIPWGEFLQAAYGRFRRDTHISLNLGVSRSTARFMNIMVSSSYLGQQCSLLGKLILLAQSRPPVFLIRHLKWDETTVWTSVNADQDERRVASSWEVMVARQRIILGWDDGSTLILRLVMPPAVLLAGGAHHMYYSLRYHPIYKSIQSLVDTLSAWSVHKVQMFESDGAYANERLIAHLIQKNKTANQRMHLLHGKCQNHQTQLINVALLSAAGHNILSRLYGFSVFVRNLGNWLRLKQALHTWVDTNLIFEQDLMDGGPGSHHPALLELIDFLRHNRKVEAEDGKVSEAFERSAATFLEFFNGNSSLETPCHHCTHASFPADQRHCADRADADFFLSGNIVHGWLPRVFSEAYKHMTFKEFNEADRTTDPRLVESLSFHAVNGRRLKSSEEFLCNREAQWAVQLLSVAMEPTRVLIFYWLGCLSVSLQAGQRPALYKLLDPRASVVIQALQHYSSLIMSTSGGGRLNLVWPRTEYVCFGEYCKYNLDKCRVIRRILMLGAAWVYRRHLVYLNDDQFSITVCGDDDAHRDTLQTFLGFWEQKRPCCYPPGLCRDLKSMNLSADDLTFGNCKRMLYFVASTLQLSIADVEAMHSQNRALHGNSFSSISAKFINAESVRIQQEARKLQYGKEGGPHADDSKDVSGHKNKGIGLSWSHKGATAKGLSALELYRKHYLELRSRSEKINPCSKEIWNDVRQAFAELSPEERSLYEKMSQDSKQQALSQRVLKKHEKKSAAVAATSEDAPSQPAALVPATGGNYGVHLQILPVKELGQFLSTTDASGEALSSIVEQHARKTEGKISAHDFPIGESTLDEVWRSQVASGLTGKAASKTFQRQAEGIARPEDQRDTFPQRVLHEGHCGEQCRHFGDPKRIALHCNTLALFTFIVQQTLDLRMGGVQAIVEEDVLCRFEVLDTEGGVYRQYAFITGCSARSGTHQPVQVFACLEPVDWDYQLFDQLDSPFAGLILDLQTLPYVEPEGSDHFPRQPEVAGRLRMFTSDQFAAFLLDLPVLVDPRLDSCQVTAHLMTYEDILPRRVKVLGVDDAITGMIATHDSAPAVERDVQPSDTGMDDEANTEPDPFDLLALLEKANDGGSCEQKSKRRKRQNTEAQNRANNASTDCYSVETPNDVKPGGDPILDDPCLQTFLTPEAIAALRHARGQCEASKSEDVQDWVQGGFCSDDSESDLEEVNTTVVDENGNGPDQLLQNGGGQASSSSARCPAASDSGFVLFTTFLFSFADPRKLALACC